MKTKDIINESRMHPEIKKILKKKGYKFLGAGQDQDVYLAPDGTILKIFGTDRDNGKYTKGQQSFIDFAEYCNEHKNNPFLPNILGFEQFEFPEGSNQWYLQIRMERLFPFTDSKILSIQLEMLAQHIELLGADGAMSYVNQAIRYNDTEAFELLSMVGFSEKDIEGADTDEPDPIKGKNTIRSISQLPIGYRYLTKALIDLKDIAKEKGYAYDLHSGNFMLSGNGDVVISDPFYTGSQRALPSKVKMVNK